MENKKIDVMESVYTRNDKIAAKLNQTFTGKNIFVINVLGAPGVGKTSTLINIIKNISCNCFVIEGDVKSDIDTENLKSFGIKALQINTDGGCHLDSYAVEKALSEANGRKDFIDSGILFIENIGNLICPADFKIGEHIKLLISNVTEGSDKPYKYPLAFEKADVILVNKIDMEKYADFERDIYLKGVKALNKSAPVFFVSAKTGEGFGDVIEWIQAEKKKYIKE